MPSKKIGQEQCPACAEQGSDNHEDNLINYEDGSAHCHACGYDQQEGTETASAELRQASAGPVASWALPGHVNAIPDRALTKVACEKYNVKTSFYTGTLGNDRVVDHPVYVLPIYEDGVLTKQKIRSISTKKMMTQVGETGCMELFGKQAFSPSKKVPVNITEGEFDAVAGHQASGYAFVSVVLGASNVIKELKANYDWLSQWQYINICFDNDSAGQKAVKELSETSLFEPGFIRVVTLPMKDANDMIMAGKSEEFKQCLWNSSILKPDSMVSVEDLYDKVLEKPAVGTPWPFPTMTKVTSGMRGGEVYLLAATKGCGKTQFCQELVTQQINNGVHVGLFSLEQEPHESLLRFIGNQMNTKLHIPGQAGWDEKLIRKELDNLKGKITLYNRKSGVPSLEGIIANIRYTSVVHSGKLFIIDNLRKLAASPKVEGKRVNKVDFMSHCMTQISAIAEELNVTVFVIQHLNTSRVTLTAKMVDEDNDKAVKAPTGSDWRQGRVPALTNIYGSGEVVDLVNHVMVLARNCESEDEEVKNTTTVKFITTRLDGQYDGTVFKLKYNQHTGRLTETEDKEEEDLFDSIK